MPDIFDTKERIERLLTAGERQIASVFMAAINALKDNLDLELLERLLLEGRVEEALDLLMDVARSLGSATTITFVTAGQSTAQFLSGVGVARVLFNQLNVRAVAAMTQNQLELITAFTAEQRAATRAALMEGVARGDNPREQARNFRNSIGLTQKQQAAVDNYRRLLTMAGDGNYSAGAQAEALTRALRDGRFDRTVQGAILRGQRLTPDQIDKMVQRYAERYVKYRAEVIARTEALRSVNQGTEETYRQAFEDGVLSPEDVIRTWDSSRDGRVRDSHRHLHGQKRAWGVPWQGMYGLIRYPGDPQAPAAETVQCRCILLTRIRR